MVFVDWLKARLQEQVYFRMINTKKIPMSASGVAIIENDIRTILDLGVTNGGIATSPSYTVTSPNVLSILEPQRVQRILGDFQFSCRLAETVNKIIVRGIVSY